MVSFHLPGWTPPGTGNERLKRPNSAFNNKRPNRNNVDNRGCVLWRYYGPPNLRLGIQIANKEGCSLTGDGIAPLKNSSKNIKSAKSTLIVTKSFIFHYFTDIKAVTLGAQGVKCYVFP